MNTIPRIKDRTSFEVGIYSNNHRRQGSDPVSQSKGSKVYNRTVWLIEQIEREQKLRAGAEKLLRAASSKRIQSEIVLELKVVNANLQAMREEMAAMSSNFASVSDINHQTKRSSGKNVPPVIPLSMKETVFIDYCQELKEFIVQHYHEDTERYKLDLNSLTDMRKACCQPISGEDGLETLFNYYNQLYFVDRRFFPANANGPVSFRWYDSFTGLPSIQKTVGFEKGSILFNIGVLYLHNASRVKWKDPGDLDEAIEGFQRSAGAFQYLHDNFLHAPSVDMQLTSVVLLIQLMMAQAFECRLEQRLAQENTADDVQSHVELAQEAAYVATMYSNALSMMSSSDLSSHASPLWIPLVKCKHCYHRARAHYHLALALTMATGNDTVHCTGVHMRVIEGRQSDSASVYSDRLADDEEGRKTLAKAHLRESILAYEEALRIACKHHKFMTFHETLKASHDLSLSKFSVLEEEDDFTELLTAPDISPKAKIQLQPILPDFSKYKVEDLFHRLGCIAIFSARHSWTVPRKVILSNKDGQEFGFSIRGDSPVIVATVDEGSLAQKSGMLVGDFIVAVGGVDIKWTKHDKVVSMIKSCGDSAVLHVVTPTDHNYIDPTQPPKCSMQMTCGSPSQEPVQEVITKPPAKDQTDSIKTRPSSASKKRRSRSSKSKELGKDNCGFAS